MNKIEKIIPRNFGHIGHLAGSKMIDDEDKMLPLDVQNADDSRVPYSELRHIGESYGLAMPPLLNYGCAIAPEVILSQYPNGLVVSRDKIEGIVYVYEHDNKFQGSAKYVSNKRIGTPQPNLTTFNKWDKMESFKELVEASF